MLDQKIVIPLFVN